MKYNISRSTAAYKRLQYFGDVLQFIYFEVCLAFECYKVGFLYQILVNWSHRIV